MCDPNENPNAGRKGSLVEAWSSFIENQLGSDGSGVVRRLARPSAV